MKETRLDENNQLRERLDRLLTETHRNEQIQSLFDQFTLAVVAAHGPKKLFHLLLEAQKRFHIDEIRLCLVDRYHEVERLLTEGYQHNYPGLSFIDTETSKMLISDLPDAPIIGKNVLSKYAWLISHQDKNKKHYQTAALLPLKRGNEIIGIQLLISTNANQFNDINSTALLTRLSAMISISIENCINRQRILEQGYQDGLTNAYNRRYLNDHLKNEVARCLRKKTDLVCLFIDIDFFKKINDNYGHQVGDAVLIKLVTLMKEQVRAGDIVARYGGEEFTVILPDTNIQLAHEIAERIRHKVEDQQLVINDETIHITVSIGMASLNQVKSEMNTNDKDTLHITEQYLDKLLIGKADEALYQAKQAGRNQVVIKEMAG
jgi:diguanylate cyclase (GGDEF)-like protein